MAIAFVVEVAGGTSNGVNRDLDISGLASVGDLVLVVSSAFGRAGNEGRIGNALGYTQIADVTNTQRVRVAWKIYVSGENTVTVEGSGNAADATCGYLMIFNGFQAGTPIDVTPTTATGNSTNPDCPAITPAHNNCMIVALAGSSAADATPGTVASYTQPTTPGAQGIDTNNASAAGVYRLLSGGGGSPENPAAWSAWLTGTWVGVTVAIRDAAVPADSPAAGNFFMVQ